MDVRWHELDIIRRYIIDNIDCLLGFSQGSFCICARCPLHQCRASLEPSAGTEWIRMRRRYGVRCQFCCKDLRLSFATPEHAFAEHDASQLKSRSKSRKLSMFWKLSGICGICPEAVMWWRQSTFCHDWGLLFRMAQERQTRLSMTEGWQKLCWPCCLGLEMLFWRPRRNWRRRSGQWRMARGQFTFLLKSWHWKPRQLVLNLHPLLFFHVFPTIPPQSCLHAVVDQGVCWSGEVVESQTGYDGVLKIQ